jgi:O-antigen/teichoic acid export membrane protein
MSRDTESLPKTPAISVRRPALALTDSENAPRIPSSFSIASLRATTNTWLTDRGKHTLAQRMAGTAFLIRVASAGLAYFSQVLLARWMGSFEFGIYVYVWTWVMLIGGLVDLGLASGAQRFIPIYIERNATALLRGYLSGSRWIAFSVATAVAGVGLLCVYLLSPWIEHHTIVPLYLGCMAIPIYAVLHTQDGIARTYDWINLALLPPYIVRQLLLIGMMAGAFFAGIATDATTAVVVAVISLWLSALGQMIMLNRRLRAKVERGPKSYDARVWLMTSLPMMLIESFYLLLMYTDVLVLNQFRSPDEVAVYYAAVKTLTLVVFVYFSVSAAASHRYSEFHVAGDRKGLEDFIAASIRWTFWPSLAATAMILAAGWPLLWLFGSKFVSGYHLMFILAIGVLARASVGPGERLLNMLGEQRACTLVAGSAFLINIVLCFVLIPHYGVEGAAASTSFAFVFESILLFYVTRRRLGFHIFVFGRPKAQ